MICRGFDGWMLQLMPVESYEKISQIVCWTIKSLLGVA